MKTLGLVVAVAAIMLLTGCGPGVPPEAATGLSKAAQALESKDKAAITAVVLPGQRTGALGLPAGIGITGADKKIADLTLDDLLNVDFFAQVKTVRANEDLQYVDDDKTVRLGVTFDFGDTVTAVRTLVLKKEGDAWLWDVKATMQGWTDTNGGHALTAIGLKK